MPNWATISIREELIEEIKRILKAGRYRSISEFVAEAIRLRLEEISRGKVATAFEVVPEMPPPMVERVSAVQPIPVSPEAEETRGYINSMLQRSEQIWWMLVRMFGDLVQRDVSIDPELARQLRNCRTLINFVHSHICPDCDIELANERLPDLQNSLEQAKRDLLAVAICVCDNYAKDWINKIDKAERGELVEPPPVRPNFVSGLPKDVDKGWTRITLSKPIAKEKVQEVSKLFGVAIKFEDDFRVVIRGEKKPVRKAVQTLYRLQTG
jgi:hypothetical protein